MSTKPESNSGLRRRSGVPDKTAASSSTKFTAEQSDNLKTRSDESSGRVSGSNRSRRTPLVLALIFLFGVSFVLRGRQTGLPRTYALCSKEGSIYTVDKDAPQVECIVVHNSRILSVGNLGTITNFPF